jgi:S-(hydroxymethyl)glutathione dehydrogenase/alcohol dehydrogenase
MTTSCAAMMSAPGGQWEIVDLELDEPKAHEVLVRFVAVGMCHSNDHLRTGDADSGRYLIVGGHAGAWVVEAVGPGVSRVEVGQWVLMSFISVCGSRRWCLHGRSALCILGRNASSGRLPDDSFRFHRRYVDVGAFGGAGTSSERSVGSECSCLPLRDDIDFEIGALLRCGVPTGWGSAVNAGAVRPGDVVTVYGLGAWG